MQQQHQQQSFQQQQIQDHIQEKVNDSKLKIQEVHLRPEALEIEHELITMRRHFHMYPETAYEEIETASYIVQKLKELKNIEVIEKVGKTGVVGVLRGGKNSGKGKCIMLRADMDALNLKENTGEEFSSKYSGKHHACGHDGHMAMLLGAAQILSKWQDKIEGDIKFCFQPAEEGYAGAKAMIQDEKYPVLQNPKVDEAYGIHLFNSKYYPHVSAQTGPMTANSDFCEIKIIGTGSSAYMPHYSQDAVYISSQLINSLYGITSRNIDPVSHQSISIGTINGGTAANIIASECSLKISVRTTTEKQRVFMENRIKEICQGFEISHKCKIAVYYQRKYNAVINEQEQVQKFFNSSNKITKTVTGHFGLAGEDFCFYTDFVPSCFFLIGSAPQNSIQDEVVTKPHHSPFFTIDERSLALGTSIWIQLVEDLLVHKK